MQHKFCDVTQQTTGTRTGLKQKNFRQFDLSLRLWVGDDHVTQHRRHGNNSDL